MLGTGAREGARTLRLHFLANGLDQARLGLIVPKRVAPRALDRNRIKRVAREAFRAMRGELPALDLVLVARSGARELDRAQLRRACDQLLGKLARN